MSKKNLAKVTVIIPCYNREKFVKETLDSALSQDYPNIEIVAVDDGSTDATRQVLDSYGSRIRVLEHQGRVNRGQSASINLAMRSTRGEYVAILDSDDLWEPEKTRLQVDVMENDPETGLVYSNGFAIDEHGAKLYKLYAKCHKEENIPDRLLVDCYIHSPSGTLARRSAYEAAGEFDESLRSAQDHDMAVRLIEVTKFSYLPDTLFKYRKHQDTLSARFSKRRWLAGFVILDKACKRRRYGWNTRRKRLAVLNFRLGQCLVPERKFLKAGLYFALTLLFDPIRSFKVFLSLERIN